MEWQSLAIGGFGALYLVSGFAVVIWEAKRPKRRRSAATEPNIRKAEPTTVMGSGIVAKAGA